YIKNTTATFRSARVRHKKSSISGASVLFGFRIQSFCQNDALVIVEFNNPALHFERVNVLLFVLANKFLRILFSDGICKDSDLSVYQRGNNGSMVLLDMEITVLSGKQNGFHFAFKDYQFWS